MSIDYSEEIIALGRLIANSRHTVALTGAGISTESGIPDYRGPNGVWATGNPPRLYEFTSSLDVRRKYWQERKTRYPVLRDTQPNRGHAALANLQQLGLLAEIITQNIDGLHQKAGSPSEQTIELHGSAHRVRCLSCRTIWPAEAIQQRVQVEEIPSCERCGGLLRATTVLFGESLPPDEFRRAVDAAGSCDLMIVVGSSLVVKPAATLPLIARSAEARLAVINLGSTPIDDIVTVRIHAGAGESLQRLVDEVTNSRS